jgi:Domain of unknown function (DUF4397)
MIKFGQIATAITVFVGALVIAPTTASAAGSDAYVRAAHFSPDTGGVDVYLTAFSGGTSTLWLSDVGYGDVSPYRAMPAGNYAVSMRPHGASAASAPALTWSVNLVAGSDYTAAAVGMNAQLHGIVLPDTTSLPGSGKALVRVVQASSQAGHASVKASDGTVLTSDTAFGAASDYVSVAAGSDTFTALSSTQPSLTSASQLTVASGSVSSLVVLDKAGGGITLRSVLDAVGASAVPIGSVPAGGGGTARTGGPDVVSTLSWIALMGALLIGASALLPGRRRRSLS